MTAATRSTNSGRSSKPAPPAAYDLSAQIGHLLRRAYQRHTALFQETIPDDRLTAVQFAVLVAIRDEQPAPLIHIGRTTAIDHATLRGIVARLKERQLVDIHNDTADRRQRIVSLTPQGEELVRTHIPEALHITELTLAPLNECERVAAMHILRKLAGI
ncbi:winged helix-turn-helix transcriptional regulator [Gluconacetobacter azotocaptans]|uniref:Winged helix-turn-helix transcriptional regulator n=1 Tax=Gluconacetobacter azotocaptans TaxID=142834 RepID=A0A7W4JPL6_9PROT|nr:MarR family winged helix-turn-helix transcriptional regulator [Gluconacetobacter azotocaptans]MBB2188605.1 winged helix-turn-helix transcriptional regulator [Gluconacetobacter azotocaptans]MBM9400309.1 winged helix-turn-helix transcriptional regulator [Gluconacetobacter azotocaptans]GBQ35388.1 MarR family transcriptional regulator [Gluconacetobacter azotocaptans DSM 13594]